MKYNGYKTMKKYTYKKCTFSYFSLRKSSNEVKGGPKSINWPILLFFDYFYVIIYNLSNGRVFNGEMNFPLFWAHSLCSIYILLFENNLKKSRSINLDMAHPS